MFRKIDYFLGGTEWKVSKTEGFGDMLTQNFFLSLSFCSETNVLLKPTIQFFFYLLALNS